MLSKYLLSILLIKSQTVVFGDAPFNYEISSRVQDNIRNLLQKVAEATIVPKLAIDADIVNISSSFGNSSWLEGWAAGRTLMFPIKRSFRKEIVLIQIGLWNKFYYAAYNQEYTGLSNLPYNLYVLMSSKNDFGIVERYSVDSRGIPDFERGSLGPLKYDCTSRPWYKQAKTAQVISWSAPYLQTNNVPGVSLVVPLVNSSFAGANGFVGTVAANIQLDQISAFLKSSYQDTGINVFIVEKSSGYLIASSLDALVYAIGPTANVSFSH